MIRLPKFFAIALAAVVSTQISAQPMERVPDRTEGEGPYDTLIVSGATMVEGSGAPPTGPVDIVIEAFTTSSTLVRPRCCRGLS